MRLCEAARCTYCDNLIAPATLADDGCNPVCDRCRQDLCGTPPAVLITELEREYSRAITGLREAEAWMDYGRSSDRQGASCAAANYEHEAKKLANQLAALGVLVD